MSAKRSFLLVNVVLAGVVGVLVYVVFIMDRSPGLSLDARIDLNVLLAGDKPILLEFGKGWCRPCKYMKPILDDAARAYKGKAIVAAVDMDANGDLVKKFSIRVMPTQVFLWQDGRVFFRNEGILEWEHIVQIFSKMGVVEPRPEPQKGAMAPDGPRSTDPSTGILSKTREPAHLSQSGPSSILTVLGTDSRSAPWVLEDVADSGSGWRF